ncbi:MAG: nucleotidyl transferase AbiEii/AbiGii toxin family protein [Nanoarchaeota archaeon]
MDIDELRRIAAKEELSLNYVAKDVMLSRALKFLEGFDDIILKGGTAINRSYIKNKRFSEDIDMDIIFKGRAKQALTRTNQIIKGFKGFDIAKPRIMKGMIRYDLFFMNPLDHKDKIRLEFKPVDKAKNYSKKVVNFGFVPHDSSLLNVYDIKEMIKHKSDCILNRLEGKDFFDLFYLIGLEHEHERLDKVKLLERINLEKDEIKAAANVVNHYIPRTKRPNWSQFLEKFKKKIKDY